MDDKMIKPFRLVALTVILTMLSAAPTFAQTSCTVAFYLDDAVDLGAISFDVDYDETRVEFVGSNDQVSCASLVPGTLPSFYDDELTGTVNSAIIGFGATFSGPRTLAICDIATGVVPVPADFVVTVTDASDGSGTPVNPLPVLSVSGINCSGTTTTTTTSTSTTTTLAGAPTTTTTTLPGEVCDVTFRLFNFVGLGALQFEADYSQVVGEFLGSGTGVDCTRLVNNALASQSDQDANRLLKVGYISAQGFQGPTDLTVCTFVTPDTGVVPEDFVVTVTDASDPASAPASAFVMASDVTCYLETTTTTTTSTTTTTLAFCGDGVVGGGEECDDGVANSDTDADACRIDCSLPFCGDGVSDSGEECDDGVANSDADGSVCFLDCTVPAVCGDSDAGGSVSAGDALIVLQRAVGQPVVCPKHRCDADGSGVLTASDAQRILKGAVGQDVTLECALDVMIVLEDAADLGSLDLSIDYSAAGDAFLGEGSAALCTNLVGGGVSAVFVNDTSNAVLSVVLTAVGSFAGPVDLAECDFFNRGDVPGTDDFAVQVLAATNAAGDPVSAPQVSIGY